MIKIYVKKDHKSKIPVQSSTDLFSLSPHLLSPAFLLFNEPLALRLVNLKSEMSRNELETGCLIKKNLFSINVFAMLNL